MSTGYDPKAALKFLEELGKIPKSEQEFEFFSTHPSAANRKRALEKRFYEFQSIYDKLRTVQTPPANTTLRKRNSNIKYKDDSPMARHIRAMFEKDDK